MLLKGRRQILSDYVIDDTKDVESVVTIINNAMLVHADNKREIDWLVNYRHGEQPILSKVKPIRPEISNELVVNHAQMISRTIVGYFLGTPIQYTQSGDDKQVEIDALNKYLAYEDKASVDRELGEYQSICGTAYRIIVTDGLYGDAVPFEDKCLNPSTTFMVYERSIIERPLMGVTYYQFVDTDTKKHMMKIYAYTNFGRYAFTSEGLGTLINSDNYSVTFEPYNVGGIPIIEYPNNIWRIGDWELTLGLMDAINALESGRIDDVEQTIQSLLVFINADIDSELYDEMRAKGVVSLKNTGNSKSEVTTISNSLDQNGMNQFSDELRELLYALIGIPERNKRGGGGGDTGQAVELRDGWADLEIVARSKELTFRKSEKQTLLIMLTIINNVDKMKLSLLDITIKFSRNKNSNLLVKTQGYMNLITTKTLSPADCLTIVDLVSDVNEYIKRGETFWGESFAGKEPIVPEITKVDLENDEEIKNEDTEQITE